MTAKNSKKHDPVNHWYIEREIARRKKYAGLPKEV